jgi:hypothetical protein
MNPGAPVQETVWDPGAVCIGVEQKNPLSFDRVSKSEKFGSRPV